MMIGDCEKHTIASLRFVSFNFITTFLFPILILYKQMQFKDKIYDNCFKDVEIVLKFVCD